MNHRVGVSDPPYVKLEKVAKEFKVTPKWIVEFIIEHKLPEVRKMLKKML